MKAVDLCCGDGGMTVGMMEAGFKVVGVDVVVRKRYPAPLILQDLLVLDPALLGNPDWIHGSPPCQRFSKARPSRVKDPPTEADLAILKACLSIIERLKPRFWTIENVSGAVPLFSKVMGPPKFKNGPYYFWGNFPPFLCGKDKHRKAMGNGRYYPTGKDPWARAVVPRTIAVPMAQAIAQEIQSVKELPR